MRNASDLPDDIHELKRRLLAAEAGLVAKTLEAEKLKLELARLKRMAFGQSSERLAHDIEQLELRLEEIETTAADAPAEPDIDVPAPPAEPSEQKPRRKLPEHLPRVTETHEPASCCCPRCGSERMRKVGEDVTEVLTYVPGRFEVVRHVRPAYSCAKCEAMAQAPMPPLPIPRAQADATVIAHVIMSKYGDHIPLYRQAEIYARDGVDIDRATLADWVGKAAWLLRPLAERIGAHVMAGSVIHADDTPVPVLAPGRGKTKIGRLWVYLRDERPHAGPAPPAVLYRYTPDRKGERCREHLAAFAGHLHADGYAGFGELYEDAAGNPAAVTEVACWAHVRRKLFDVHKTTGSTIAREALDKIGALFEIERGVGGSEPDRRRSTRQEAAVPRLAELAAWLDAQLARVPGKSDLAGAIRYARSRWLALTRCLMLGGGTLLLLLALNQFGFNLELMAQKAVATHKDGIKIMGPGTMLSDPITAVSLSLGIVFGNAGLPHIMMRFFTVPNAREARKSVFVATGLIGYFFLVVCIIGLAAISVLGNDPQYWVDGKIGGKIIGGGNMPVMHLAKALGGDVLMGFLSAVAFATILAVVAGLALAGASAIAHDLYVGVFAKGNANEGTEMKVSRIATVGMGIAAILLGIAFKDQNVAFLVALAFGVAASVNFPVLILSMYWKGLTTRGALWGGLAGLFSAVTLVVLSPAVWKTVLGNKEAIFPYDHPALFSMTLAFLVTIIVSKLDSSVSARAEQAAFDDQYVRAQTGVGAATAAAH